jgi:hypothetical protein
MATVPELAAAGVTNVYVNVASFATSPREAPGALQRVADAFRTVA